jgi:hypothetical protein
LDGTAPLSGRLLQAASLLSLAGLAGSLLVCFVATTLALTGTASPRESDATNLITRLHPLLMRAGAVLGLAACAGGLALGIAEFRRRRFLSGGGFALAAAGAAAAVGLFLVGWLRNWEVTGLPAANDPWAVFSQVALLCACAGWAIASWDLHVRQESALAFGRAEDRIRSCLAACSWRHVLAGLPAVLLTSGLMVAGIFGIDGAVNALALAWRHASTAGIGGSILLTLSTAVIAGAMLGSAMLAVLGLLVLLTRIGGRIGLIAAARPTLIAGALAGAGCFLFLRLAVFTAFGDYTRQLGLDVLINCVLLSASLIYGVLLSQTLRALCMDDSYPPGMPDLVRFLAMAVVLAPLQPVWRVLNWRMRGRLAMGAALTVIAVAGLVLVEACYPELVDATSVSDLTCTAGLVLLGVLLAGLLFPPRSRRWIRWAVAAAGLLVPCLALRSGQVLSHESRTLAYEYSRVSSACMRIVDEVLPSESAPDPASTICWPATPQWNQPAVVGLISPDLAKDKPLIIVVLLDACRKDHMSIYGYGRPTTPNMDRRAGEFLRFTNAFSQATATTCSLRHLFTGRYSSRFMLKKKGIGPFFTNDLIVAGYRTFHLNIIGSDYNSISEEAFLRDLPEDLKARAKFVAYKEYDERKKVEKLFAFLDQRQDANGMFAFLHMAGTHFPWKRSYDEGVVAGFGASQTDLYDRTIVYSDLAVGQLMDGLERRGLLDKSILIFTADHGSGLNEHGCYGGFHPWREQISVPLLIRIPGVPGRRIDSMAAVFDIGPTLLELLMPGYWRDFDGRSLCAAIAGLPVPNNRVLFGLNSFDDCYYLVTEEGLHYIRSRSTGTEDLYDWIADPLEQHRLLSESPALHTCRRMMDQFLYQGKGRYSNPYHYREYDEGPTPRLRDPPVPLPAPPRKGPQGPTGP